MKKTFNNKVCYYEAAREISFEETSIPPLQKCASKARKDFKRERENRERQRETQTKKETFLTFCVKELLFISIFAKFVV